MTGKLSPEDNRELSSQAERQYKWVVADILGVICFGSLAAAYDNGIITFIALALVIDGILRFSYADSLRK